MNQWVLSHEQTVRLSVFFAVFASMAVCEALIPRRRPTDGRASRWPSNLAVVGIDTALVRVVFPMGAVGVATLFEGHGWGPMNVWAVPLWIAIPFAVIILDLAVYLQHVLFHAAPMLWRLHRMHHADLDFDVTTGVRFHPIEIILSMAIKLTVVAGLGAPAAAVLAFEVLLNATALFNHSNVWLPSSCDRLLRLFVVTPDMHRIHHSVDTRETNSNFGFNLPWWDHLFGTYRDQPVAGHSDMMIGLHQFRHPSEQRFDRLLTQPFREPKQDGLDYHAVGPSNASPMPDSLKSRSQTSNFIQSEVEKQR